MVGSDLGLALYLVCCVSDPVVDLMCLWPLFGDGLWVLHCCGCALGLAMSGSDLTLALFGI